MYTSNIKVITKLPKLVSTIGDIPEEVKEIISPYGNKWSVYNFGYQFSNPLILPFDVNVYAVVYGNISLSSTVVNSNVFVVEDEVTNKLTITGNGTVFLWYRYGHVDPGTFDTVMSYAIENNDYVLIDALLHTLSICEAISFVLQNPEIQEIFKKGLDWQFNKIGFTDFLAYINGGKYDVKKLALFLTIASYVFPCVFTYTSIPRYNGNPIQVFIMYLMYLNEFGQVITSELVYLSEQSVYHQSEISDLFGQTASLSGQIETLSSEVTYLSEQSTYHQSEISVLFGQSMTLSEQIDYLSSEVYSLSEEVDTQSAEIGVLFVETYLMQSEIEDLSEDIVSEQSEIVALSEYVSGCCNNVLIQLGQVLTDLVKITGVLGYLISTLGSEGLIALTSEQVLDNVLSGILTDVSEAVSGLLGIVSEVLPLGQILNGLTNLVSQLLPILKVSINVSGSGNTSKSSSSEPSSSESSSSGGLLGGILGGLL